MRLFATASRRIAAIVLACAAVSAQAANYSDIWWNPGESGWGLTIADHETNLWAVWYTYRRDGSSTWMFASGGAFDAGHTRFTGPLYEATGPSWRAASASRPVTVTPVGSIAIDFAPAGQAAGTALFSYTVGDVSGTKQIQRYGFGNAAPAWGRDATDLWWDPSDSGWGIALTQHGTTLFGVWYTYDDGGQPLFVVLPGGTPPAAGGFAGDLFTTRGPWFGNATFDSTQVHTIPFGSAQVTLAAAGAVHGFTPQRGDWTTRVADGTTIDKFFTQLAFGNAAPATPPPPCLLAGTCVSREAPAASGNCSYRTCTAATMSEPDYYGYSMGMPCACSDAATANVACTAARPQVAEGASCAAGQGCAVGSVCADLRNGMPAICMPLAMFNASYCGY
jgi:hypothetical protein